MEVVTDNYGTVTAAISHADGSGAVTTTGQDGVVTYAATTNPDGSGSFMDSIQGGIFMGAANDAEGRVAA
jgi:hypothetical protein